MARTKRKTKTGRKVIAAILAVLIVIAAVLVFLNRDELFGSGSGGSDGSAEPYSYEYGANQQFALVGNQLAIASSTGLQLLDNDGYTLVRQVFSMKNPAVSAGDKHCVFYDVGGTALRLYSDGEIKELDTTGSIISVSMCRSGYFAVSCEESGYKGAVTVYNDKGKPAYKWSSGTSGYVLDAALSPDGSRLAVLCLDSSGSAVHLFELKSEAETGAVYLPGELAFKVAFTDNGFFCALSESALHFYKADGGDLSVTDFGDMTLMDFSLSDSLCVISLSKYVTGSSVELNSFSAEGKALGTAALDYSPLSLSACNQKLMVLGSGEATVFSQELNVLSKTEIPAGYGSAVYLPDGQCLFLSSYHGEKISIK